MRSLPEDLREHTDQTQSVIPSEQWKQWFLGLDERVSFSPSDAADFERSLWQIMEKVTCGSPPTLLRPESMVGNIMIERCGNLSIDCHLSPSFNWRNGGTGGLPSCGTWNQLSNGPLKKNCGNTGLTDLLAICPVMLRTFQRWQQ